MSLAVVKSDGLLGRRSLAPCRRPDRCNRAACRGGRFPALTAACAARGIVSDQGAFLCGAHARVDLPGRRVPEHGILEIFGQAAKAASRPHSPFRSRPPIRRCRLPQGSRRSRDDPIHAPAIKIACPILLRANRQAPKAMNESSIARWTKVPGAFQIILAAGPALRLFSGRVPRGSAAAREQAARLAACGSYAINRGLSGGGPEQRFERH
jgi:hypothetical protein